MADCLLDEKIVKLGAALQSAEVPYAFGGAIALAYYAAPRGTEDIDVNVFLPEDEADRVREALAPLGVLEVVEAGDAQSHQRLLHWAHTPIHVFYAYDAFHESCRARVRHVPFADVQIPVLSAEDITLFKVVYDRPKDRSEVREVLLCMGTRLDAGYVTDWLIRLLGEGDPRVARFRSAVDELRGVHSG